MIFEYPVITDAVAVVNDSQLLSLPNNVPGSIIITGHSHNNCRNCFAIDNHNRNTAADFVHNCRNIIADCTKFVDLSYSCYLAFRFPLVMFELRAQQLFQEFKPPISSFLAFALLEVSQHVASNNNFLLLFHGAFQDCFRREDCHLGKSYELL